MKPRLRPWPASGLIRRAASPSRSHRNDRAGRAQNQGVRCYDGSDQEFWRSFYRPTYELPLRYHAHQNLKMSNAEWRKIRVIHTISGFRRRDRAPPFVRKAMRYFDQPNAGWVGGTSKKVR